MYNVTVKKIVQESSDTISFVLDKPQGISFKPGQYGIFEATYNEEVIKRSYSFSSSPTEDFLMITVKLIPGGKMSTYFSTLKEGDILKFIGPVGKFVYENHDHVVFIAAGSGITPFRSMLKFIYDTQCKTNVDIFYGAKTPADLLFYKELQQLAKEHDNTDITFTVRQPDAQWKGYDCYIDIKMLKKHVEMSNNTHYFLCGPAKLVIGMKKEMKHLGIHDENINVDAWG